MYQYQYQDGRRGELNQSSKYQRIKVGAEYRVTNIKSTPKVVPRCLGHNYIARIPGVSCVCLTGTTGDVIDGRTAYIARRTLKIRKRFRRNRRRKKRKKREAQICCRSRLLYGWDAVKRNSIIRKR